MSAMHKTLKNSMRYIITLFSTERSFIWHLDKGGQVQQLRKILRHIKNFYSLFLINN